VISGRMDVEFRCVTGAEGARCTGALSDSATGLKCVACGQEYVRHGNVPMLMQEDQCDSDARAFYETYVHARQKHLDDVRRWTESSGYCRGFSEHVAQLVVAHRIDGPSLEIGAAGALCADVLPGYVALEYSLAALLIPGFDKYDRVCADAQRLPFPDRAMQFIVSVNTLEHVPEASEAFQEIHRVLAPGGIAFLSPAWNCAGYNTELIPITPYARLKLRQRITKLMLPLLRSKIYKAATRIPRRIWRACFASHPTTLRFRRLNPCYGVEQLTDQDAAASIDPAEAILFFTSRGYECLSHPSFFGVVTTGHRPVIVKKPISR
jgi:SAM-dependent methyltransferase